MEAANTYIAVDLETTGLNPKEQRIIEIGAIRVEDGEITGRYQTLVNPQMELEERIVELTGITGEMLKTAPVIGDILPEFLTFCGELPLLGHHVIFDYSFLKKEVVKLPGKAGFERDGIDTLSLSRKFMPPEEKKNLSAACAYFHIPVETSHRALEDAISSHALYQKLKNDYFKVRPEAFALTPLIYKVKKAQPASKRQKELLRELVKYHKITLTVELDSLTRNEISRITDKIISVHGRIQGEKRSI